MRLAPVLVSLPLLWWVATNTNSTPANPMAQSSASPSPPAAATPSPSPSPSPVPTNAFLSLDVTAGPPDTQITVNGGAFLSNEQMTLYWDQPGHVAGSAVADGNGNFSAPHIKPFAGDQPGLHKLCASVAPNPCADFTLEPPASPSPSPSPTPSESPSPSPVASPSPTSSPTPITTTLSGLDVISRPPFVFLPVVGVLAILVSVGYWLFSVLRRPAVPALPSAAVVHRATRPDYTSGFGTPPPAPAGQAAEPSAWADYVPKTATPAPYAGPAAPTAPAGPATAGPVPPGPPPELPAPHPTAWSELPAPSEESYGAAQPDEPLDLPEPGEE